MTAVAEQLTADAARELTTAIRTTAEQIHALLLQAYEGRAWSALGYESWREYATVELGISQSHAYRLLDHARIVRGIEAAAVSPIGELPTEGQARELARVPEPDRADVWAETVAETNGKPTAAAVRDVAERRNPPKMPLTPEEVDELRIPDPQPARPPAAAAAQDREPDPAVAAWLDADPTLADAKYLAAFANTVARCDDFAQFDAEKIGRLADADLWAGVEILAEQAGRFVETGRRARRRLSIITGGVGQ